MDSKTCVHDSTVPLHNIAQSSCAAPLCPADQADAPCAHVTARRRGGIGWTGHRIAVGQVRMPRMTVNEQLHRDVLLGILLCMCLGHCH